MALRAGFMQDEFGYKLDQAAPKCLASQEMAARRSAKKYDG
jgi:hypothetical protein